MSAIYANSMTYFAQGDHLGSTRLLTGYPTPSIVECDDYYPFGELTSCGGSSITTHEFTGNERDSKSDLDNFGARYDSSAMGRFMSPDPGNAGADPSNPQSWNMYSYVMNDPLTLTDPTGMFNLGSDGSDCDLFFGCGGFGLLFDLGIGNENDRQPPIYTPPATQNTTEPNPPAGDPSPTNNPFSGETFGIPNGLQLPSDLASVILPTDPSCEFVACTGFGFTSGDGSSWWQKWGNKISGVPWMVSWILPLVGPVPGAVGVGPAGSIAYNPQTHNLCVSVGAGASVGHNISGGPITNIWSRNGGTIDKILSGWSISGGYNSPGLIGVEGTANSAGAAGGPTIGTPGGSIAATGATCVNVP